MSAVYLDTSAAVKLIVVEAESGSLRDWLGQQAGSLLSSALLAAELLRATTAHGTDAVIAARRVVNRLNLGEVDRATLEMAGHLNPPAMRTLDAIHLATALRHGHLITAFVTYDSRLMDACRNHGLQVVSPGAA